MRRSFVLVALLSIAALSQPHSIRGQFLNGTISSSSAAGVIIACPAGDGDLLSEKGLTITATLTTWEPLPNIPASDIWVVGCSNGLDLCAGVQPFNSGVTDANGTIVLDGRISASGCDNSGLRVMALAPWTIFDQSNCVPIQTRSPDLKSSGPGACGGDIICPDGEVSLSDYGYLTSHYPTLANPSPPYQSCLDYASPFGSPIGLADFAKFAVYHYNQNGARHGCPI